MKVMKTVWSCRYS